MMSFSKIEKKLIIVALALGLINFVIVYLTGYMFLAFSMGSLCTKKLFGKAMVAFHVLILIAIWQGIVYAINSMFIIKYRINRKMFLYSITYFLIMLMILYLVYPGAWSADDYGVLRAAHEMQILPWQNFISSVFMIQSLMLIPIMAGPIIVQIILISIIVGYLISRVNEIFRVKSPLEWMLIFPFILPAILSNNFSAFRAIMHGYLLLLLMLIFFCCFFEQKRISERKLSGIVFLSIVVGGWRTEYIFYVITIPILMFALGRSRISFKRVVIASIVIIIGILGIGKINNTMLTNNNYSLIQTYDEIADLMLVVDNDKDKEEIAALEKIINLDIFRSHPGEHGVYLHWQYNLIKGSYTEQDYKAYLKAYIKLCLKYPKTFLANRVECFIDNTGINKKQTSLTREACLLYENYDVIKDLDGMIAINPLNSELRKTTLRLLGCENEDYKKNNAFCVFWNTGIGIIYLMIFLILFIRKKQWYLLLLIGNILSVVGLLFLTTPYYYFMYYFSLYLLGNVTLIIGIHYLIHKKENAKM